VFTSLYIFT